MPTNPIPHNTYDKYDMNPENVAASIIYGAEVSHGPVIRNIIRSHTVQYNAMMVDTSNVNKPRVIVRLYSKRRKVRNVK